MPTVRLLALACCLVLLPWSVRADEAVYVTVSPQQKAKAVQILKRGVALDVARRRAEAAWQKAVADLNADGVAFIEAIRIELGAKPTDVWDWTAFGFKPAPPQPKAEEKK